MHHGKKVSESAVVKSPYRIFPNDLNSQKTVFGGLVMSLCDRTASVVAEVHSKRICVTAAVDAMNFLAPAEEGDVLLVSGSINRSWRTSMEIGIRVEAENYRTGSKTHILSAYFTFVALDDQRRPVEIPSVIPETSEEKRRYEEAEYRRQSRKAYAEGQAKRRQEGN